MAFAAVQHERRVRHKCRAALFSTAQQNKPGRTGASGMDRPKLKRAEAREERTHQFGQPIRTLNERGYAAGLQPPGRNAYPFLKRQCPGPGHSPFPRPGSDRAEILEIGRVGDDMVKTLGFHVGGQIRQISAMHSSVQAIVIQIALRQCGVGGLHLDTCTRDTRHTPRETGECRTSSAAQFQHGVTSPRRDGRGQKHRIDTRAIPVSRLPQLNSPAQKIIAGQFLWRKRISPQT